MFLTFLREADIICLSPRALNFKLTRTKLQKTYFQRTTWTTQWDQYIVEVFSLYRFLL